MNITKKHREVNIVSSCAQSIVRFRMIGLNCQEKTLWEKRLASVPCEWFLRNNKDYVCLCVIDNQEVAKDLRSLLTDVTIPFEHGLCISLVTDRGKDGMRLSPFISEFYRSIGGTVDFSFVCGILRRKTVLGRRKHREVNIVSGNAESTVTFYMEGLSRADKLLWEKKLASIPCEWHYLRKLESYECLCRMKNPKMAKKLMDLFSKPYVHVNHGICISVVTDRDNDGLRLASFVAEFYQRIGGTMDFYLECGL